MHDGAHISTLRVPNALAGQRFAAAGDFDGDNFPDILLQNTTTNQLTVQLTTGTFPASPAAIDLGEATALKSTFVLGTMPTGFQVVATGYLNYSNRLDLILENLSTGALQLWEWANTSPPSLLILNPFGTLPAGWHVAGTATSIPEIVFQNTSTQATNVAFVGSNRYISYQATPPGNAIPLAGVLDLNLDNVPDFLFRDTSPYGPDQFNWRMKMVSGTPELASATAAVLAPALSYVPVGVYTSMLAYTPTAQFLIPRSAAIYWDPTAHQLQYSFFDQTGAPVNNQKLPTTATATLTLLNSATINF